ncbi:hypothetical protein K504DRAFT_505498 [Pleomassaria siparia CBS 279.74]|uniref:Rhodopsin domain-containing protein n=1 Tax=Pleomassaria siparia CBS 279.74 TaxID=1314801 RepID=A0A6G1JZX4_9PLEO|nr:hypothetical protein K504DRAFT_505498 [Pleomassaria siparia CBS 279.74]
MERFANCSIPLLLDPNVCPALASPVGVIPMNPNAFTLRPTILATTAVCAALVGIALTVRILTKAFILKNMQVEDYFLILAACSFGAFMGVFDSTFQYGLGKHQWDVSIADVMKFAKYVNIATFMYAPIAIFAKLALLLQIQRIFSVNKATLHIAWFLMVINTVCYTMFFFMFVFACTPRDKIWNPSLPGHCLNQAPILISSSALNLLSDVAILVLPLVTITTLQMPTRRKLSVGAIFATGTFGIIASVLRLVYTIKFTTTSDVTYWSVYAAIWCDAEFTAMIICGCLPSFPSFFHFLIGDGGKTNSKNTYASTPVSGQNGQPFASSVKTKKSRKGVYSWNDTVLEEEMGSYIPLDERTTVVGASNTVESEDVHSLSSLRPGGEKKRESVIYKTVDIETTSSSR